MSRPHSERPRAVLDTSVLVPEWSRLVLQRLAAPPHQRFLPLWSEWIIAETWTVLTSWSMRLGWSEGAISAESKKMLRHLLPVMHTVSIAGPASNHPLSPLRDADDAPIWTTAVLGEADYVISHNTRDFPPLIRTFETVGGWQRSSQRHIYQGIEFLTAIEFIEDVLGEQAATHLGRPLPPRGIIRSQRRVTSS